MDPNTYRDGYYGGIYQVDQIGFQDTQDVASHPGLANKYEAIMDNYGIDWPSVQYEDLEKPLYSGIASRLYISNNPLPIPEDRNGQAQYWKDHYNTQEGAGSVDNFPNKREANLGSSERDVEDFLNCPSCVCSKSKCLQ